MPKSANAQNLFAQYKIALGIEGLPPQEAKEKVIKATKDLQKELIDQVVQASGAAKKTLARLLEKHGDIALFKVATRQRQMEAAKQIGVNFTTFRQIVAEAEKIERKLQRQEEERRRREEKERKEREAAIKREQELKEKAARKEEQMLLRKRALEEKQRRERIQELQGYLVSQLGIKGGLFGQLAVPLGAMVGSRLGGSVGAGLGSMLGAAGLGGLSTTATIILGIAGAAVVLGKTLWDLYTKFQRLEISAGRYNFLMGRTDHTIAETVGRFSQYAYKYKMSIDDVASTLQTAARFQQEFGVRLEEYEETLFRINRVMGLGLESISSAVARLIGTAGASSSSIRTLVSLGVSGESARRSYELARAGEKDAALLEVLQSLQKRFESEDISKYTTTSEKIWAWISQAGRSAWYFTVPILKAALIESTSIFTGSYYRSLLRQYSENLPAIFPSLAVKNDIVSMTGLEYAGLRGAGRRLGRSFDYGAIGPEIAAGDEEIKELTALLRGHFITRTPIDQVTMQRIRNKVRDSKLFKAIYREALPMDVELIQAMQKVVAAGGREAGTPQAINEFEKSLAIVKSRWTSVIGDIVRMQGKLSEAFDQNIFQIKALSDALEKANDPLETMNDLFFSGKVGERVINVMNELVGSVEESANEWLKITQFGDIMLKQEELMLQYNEGNFEVLQEIRDLYLHKILWNAQNLGLSKEQVGTLKALLQSMDVDAIIEYQKRRKEMIDSRQKELEEQKRKEQIKNRLLEFETKEDINKRIQDYLEAYREILANAQIPLGQAAEKFKGIMTPILEGIVDLSKFEFPKGLAAEKLPQTFIRGERGYFSAIYEIQQEQRLAKEKEQWQRTLAARIEAEIRKNVNLQQLNQQELALIREIIEELASKVKSGR